MMLGGAAPAALPVWVVLTVAVLTAIIGASGGWYISRAQRRSFDATASASGTAALADLLEHGAAFVVTSLRDDLTRLRADLEAAQQREYALEDRVTKLEGLLSAARNRIGRLEGALRSEGVDPSEVNGTLA